MKKLIISSVCAIAAAGSVFAQGNVQWQTISAAAVTFATNTVTYSSFTGGGPANGGTTGVAATGVTQGAASLGSGFYYELLVGSAWNGSAQALPTSFAQFSSWTDSGLSGTNNPVTAGRASVFASQNNAGATVNAMSPSASNSIVLVGWSANLGTTWSTALATMEAGNWTGNAFFGMTAEGYIEALSTTSSPGAVIFGNSATTQGVPIGNSLNTQLYLLAVPEPGTIALAALGGASLLLFRRKK